jgi:CRP-like cAMP-binding protein
VKEFVDFLGSQPPYDALDTAELERLAGRLEVEYVTAGAVIVPAGGQPLDHLYVVRTGAVEILDRGRVVDLLGPGDTFGHVSVLGTAARAVGPRRGGHAVLPAGGPEDGAGAPGTAAVRPGADRCGRPGC